MFPLRHKSVVSMRKMQELQPQLKAIQDRYANLKVTDPARQKMNTEVMNLYREKGVNPASGCVPMLLTMPVLFAFYALLRRRSSSAARRSAAGSRSVAAGSVLRDADLMGADDVLAAEDDAGHGGSDAAEDDDAHADRCSLFMFLWRRRAGDLLVRE